MRSDEIDIDFPSLIDTAVFSDGEMQKVEAALKEMDIVSLRALIRRCAHQIDSGMQRYILRPIEARRIPERARSILGLALNTWAERGYKSDKADIIHARDALKRGDEFAAAPIYNPSVPHALFDLSELKALERVIAERRSIRRFKQMDIPDEILMKVLKASQWAPNACNLQGSRFIAVKDAETKKLLMQPWDAPVVIFCGLDERPYQFIKGNPLPYNKFIDLGAAIQNMLLMAYALGLGACLGTFVTELVSIRQALKVPGYVQIVTYFAMGWPDDNPVPPPRMEIEEVVSVESWSTEHGD